MTESQVEYITETPDPWDEYERRKQQIAEQAETPAEYDRLTRGLLDELGL